jgi:hypothetical protein
MTGLRRAKTMVDFGPSARLARPTGARQRKTGSGPYAAKCFANGSK